MQTNINAKAALDPHFSDAEVERSIVSQVRAEAALKGWHVELSDRPGRYILMTANGRFIIDGLELSIEQVMEPVNPESSKPVVFHLAPFTPSEKVRAIRHGWLSRRKGGRP